MPPAHAAAATVAAATSEGNHLVDVSTTTTIPAPSTNGMATSPAYPPPGSGEGFSKPPATAAALREHAIFVGQNHSVCLPIRDFPELRSSCVYFTTPCLCNDDHFPSRREGWKGVGIYDLQNQIFEDVFPSCERGYSTYLPISEVWITPSPGL
uniref:KIB1-4 beta-propeller domain-containing protein n=1 Tax=Oryza nivara TaxID=4536 RepID=A0A0E0H4C8_ORYNI